MTFGDALFFYEYLQNTLGVHYIPRQAPNEAILSNQTKNHVIWQRPQTNPKVIFFNQDLNTRIHEAEVNDLFQKIIQAMGLSLDQVWFVDSHDRSFMDFLSWLKNQKLLSRLVVMKSDPDIQSHVQNAGTFDWVECFPLRSMLDRVSLKKPTWEVLKILMEPK